MGFQGDHYDVDESDRRRAIELGAVPIGSRDLVRRLRNAGLRDRTAKPQWEQLATWDIGIEIAVVDIDAEIRTHLGGLTIDTRAARVVLLADPGDVVLLLDLPPGAPPVESTGGAVIVGDPRADGWRSVEIFATRRSELVRPESGPR
jgi:hypothetical protein